MTRLAIRPRTPDDDQAIVGIWHRIRPQFPEPTVEDYRHEIATIPPTARAEFPVAEQEGEIVGAGELYDMFWAEEPGRVGIGVVVLPDRWCRGIGSRLYDCLLMRAREWGGSKLYGNIQEGDEHAERFVLARGFTRTDHAHRMSRLDVRNANLDGYAGLEEQLRREGLRIATLAELGAGDEEVLRRVYALDMETARDVPSSEEHKDVPYQTWQVYRLEAPGASPESIWLALDGERPVGIAALRRQGRNAAWNSFTGVLRDYRGRGVARALKRRTIDWSRRNGVDFIYTGNDVTNKRMLAVNIRLGYQPLPAFLEVVKQL